ncbi:5-hydroxymethyl-dUMP N-hydrolase isoform X1 [Latimeria chalumnae]|uniref:5-hydroxymethyl-dUMP N-hydrolase isoform X1 n=1 Tax=Latimeria chalumnae TaxID=7897 RepID=UPI0006D8E18B|nr:PREDICTED: 2'-deoxynucleoside 5'-phosphate N-hydrolase 1 [Latimeria chalumnae]|eukprot:XP_014344231.1 PREDICTED: 2'-deoxynucleoside 5'-phosphate N-hydrolase 1 [Latimeria chalumnae]
MMSDGSWKIYFCGSICGGREDVALYGRAVRKLQRFGAVLTEHVGNPDISERGEELGEKLIHDQDVEWLKEADVVVAEVTQPSLGVGYEIGRAVALNKRILCLFRPLTGRVLSAMIRGAENGVQFQVCDYVEKDLERTIQEYFEKLPPAPVKMSL